MVKRKLSDVLRAESSKSQEPKSQTSGDRATDATSKTANARAGSTTPSTPKSTTKPPSTAVPQEDSSMTAASSSTTRRRSSARKTPARKAPAAKKTPATKVPTKADLEKLVTEMKAALQESSDKEERLNNKVTDLQAQLDKANAAVKELKEYLAQANQLKADLDRATQANVDLTKEVKTLQKERDRLKAKSPAKSPAKPAAKAAKPSTSLARREAYRATIEREMHRDSAERPVGASDSPTQTGEDFTKQTWLL